MPLPLAFSSTVDAAAIVDQLRVQVIEAAIHGEARPLRRPAHVHAHAAMALRAAYLAIGVLDHAAVFAPLPALPALRRIFSPRYITPLPLYGSGGRRERMSAATWPTASFSMPETENLV